MSLGDQGHELECWDVKVVDVFEAQGADEPREQVLDELALVLVLELLVARQQVVQGRDRQGHRGPERVEVDSPQLVQSDLVDLL